MQTQDQAAQRVAAAQRAISEATANGSKASAREINSFVSSLTRAADTAGKTRAEILQLRAASLGVASSTQQYIERIAEASKHTEEFSLKTAGARRELLVLAHEASQGSWKNFGGSLMVLGERTDAMASILSPAGMGISAALAAIGALGVAMYKGAAESDALSSALKSTGNFAGKTAGQVSELVVEIGSIQGGTTEAQKVLTGLISTGRFSGDALAAVAKSVIAMSDATGESADKVIEQYVKMSDGVAKWAEEQNKQYHFLTLAQYDHIKALDESGAQSAAQAQVADQLTEALGKQHTELGWLPAAWHAVGEAAQSAWRQMMNLGKPTSAEDKLSALKAELVQATTDLAVGGTSSSADGVSVFASKDDMQGRIKQLQTQIANQQAFVDNEQKFAAQQAENGRIHQAAIDADNALTKSLESLDKGYAKDEAMRKLYQQFAALKKEYENTGVMPSNYRGVSFDVHTGGFSGGLYDKAAADIADKFKDKSPKHQKAYTDDAATRFIQQLRDQSAQLQAQLVTSDKLTAAEKDLVKFNQQVGDWKGKTLTADQRSLLANQDAIRAQLQKNVELEKEVQHNEDIAKLKERSAQIDASIASYQKGQNEQYGRQLDAFGMGSEAVRNAQAVKSIYAEYQRLQEQLDKATPKDLIGGTDYVKASADITAGLDQSLQDYDSYYASLKAKQADWTNGASEAFANYRDSAANVAASTATAFQDAFRGMEDAFASFVTTGKLNFGDLAKSVISDIARIQARAAISGLFSAAASAMSSYFGGGVSATASANAYGFHLADGGAVSGPGTSTSDSIPAWLSNGEGVLNAAAMRKLGVGGLNALNSGASVHSMSRFATGGYVGATASSALGGSIGDVSIQIVNNSSSQVQPPQVSTDSSGKKFIRLIIDQAKNEMAGDIASGQGSASKALSQRFGLTPRFR
jgi:lambda family phage tail tape measure protein